ncbi:MAG: L,D-transpeptidase [Arcobacter sp.]|uniref:L,D-transpeptidase n=1 Tax=Arcobacter sp. TaxID=1872629 RepID=UPI002A75D835|nr:L,D-transpeptidase [Arcobacter sp.]MDY3205149.1 L,D-transpeptidase [Arcobacter sp.]
MIKKIFLSLIIFSFSLYANNEKDSILETKEFLEKSSNYLKQQIVTKKNSFNEEKFFEDFSTIGTKIFDRYTPKLSTFKKVDNLLSEMGAYDSLIIEVDSSKNLMKVIGKYDNKTKNLKTYKVSTAKKDIKKPLGVGQVTSITLNPVWYPTVDTIESFKKRGIELPKVVKAGDKLNYMGSAKINLSHKVDGKETFRIHGTINEKTIGSYESSGCIRMKNSEVVQLVALLNEFIDFKSMDDIKVVLK